MRENCTLYIRHTHKTNLVIKWHERVLLFLNNCCFHLTKLAKVELFATTVTLKCCWNCHKTNKKKVFPVKVLSFRNDMVRKRYPSLGLALWSNSGYKFSQNLSRPHFERGLKLSSLICLFIENYKTRPVDWSLDNTFEREDHFHTKILNI